MPIKVRCQGCRAVFNVPDAARGRAIRCPKCQTKFRVPSKQPKADRPAQPAEDEDPLASLDLSELEDKSARVCPRCGTEVTEEDIECPNCFVDLTTGVMRESTRRRLSRKGPDPSLYYRGVWKEAWQFTMENKPIVFRTIFYLTFWTLISLGCVFMVSWCRNIPPRFFWGFVAGVTGLVPLGWLWHLDTEIVAATVNRKEQLPRIPFDFFLCVALGIKAIAWELAVCAQTVVSLIGVGLLVMGNYQVGGILLGVGVLITLPLLPIAIAHMAMPVSWPAWAINKLGEAFVKTLGPPLYWCVVLFVTSLPIIGLLGGAAAWKGRDVARMAGTVVYNMQLPPSSEEGGQAPEPKPVEWQVLVVPGIGLVASIFLAGFIAVYNMRSNGLMAYYCKPKLGLITVKKEKKYVRKTPRKAGKTIDIDVFQSVNMDRIRWAVWLFFAGLASIVALFGGIAAAIALKVTTPVAGWVLLSLALAIPLCFCTSLILFLTVPAETGAAPYVWSAFALQIIGFGFYVGANFVGDEVLKGLVAGGGAMAHFISLIVFFVFLEQLGRFLRKETIVNVAKIGTYSLVASVVGALVAIIGGKLAKSGVLAIKPALWMVFGSLGVMVIGFLMGLVSVVIGLLALGTALEELHRKKRRRRRQVVVEE